jgi:hypothetical protein
MAPIGGCTRRSPFACVRLPLILQRVVVSAIQVETRRQPTVESSACTESRCSNDLQPRGGRWENSKEILTALLDLTEVKAIFEAHC